MGKYHTKEPLPGETMEKTRIITCIDHMSGQIIPSVRENITPSGATGAVRKPGSSNRNGV